ncbi:MAG TPA: OmpA family protein [Prolixibacteraceae bacterium]
MKKTFLLLLIVAFTATVNSQTMDKKWGFGIGIGAYGTVDKGNIGAMPELYFGRYLSTRFDLLLQGDLGLWRTNVKSDLDLANAFLNLRYKLYNETKNFRPYLYAGPGFLADNGSSGVNFDLGLGAKYYITANSAFYAKAGYINGIKVAGETENLWNATAGMEFDFGKAKDSDMDGVSDKKDKCPNTPAGVAVDDKGCPVDSDGDGVADYLDDCPTVAGVSSLKGCPDKDKDGIADKDDACPDVAGPASLKGCPDSDGDGVADKDDKCPATKKGIKVDASGCPLDTDKDGVADSEDNCPTVAGTVENKGCPAQEAEKPKLITRDQIELQNVKAGPIHFTSGKSYLTDYSKGILDKLVKLLNQDKAYNVNIFGYADSQGSDESNLKLSQERINSTIQYLESKGISESRIIKQDAFGEAKPTASNATAEGRLLNRRVEFEIFKMK